MALFFPSQMSVKDRDSIVGGFFLFFFMQDWSEKSTMKS